MSGAHPRAAWLDAMGVERWVLRGASDELPDSGMVWLNQPDSPVLTVLTCTALSTTSTAIFDRMLAAINLSSADCAIGQADVPQALPPDSTGPLLILAHDADESAWRDAFSRHATHAEVIAHPDRFTADPSLKRPAWEALKRLEHTLSGG